MNKVFSFIALAFLGCGSAAAQQVNVSNVQRPKLVVGIVVDQMRWDYLYRYQKRYGEGGFKRLLNEGFSCENTRIPYVPSVTAIGHTCLYTGSVPSIHRSEEHTSELQSRFDLVCRLLLEKKKKKK